MMKKMLFAGACLYFSISCQAANYFVSPDGADAAAGTQAAPFLNISKAVSLVQPGDTIYILPGTYKYTAMTLLDKSGTADKPICLFAYDKSVKPVLDYTDAFNSTDLTSNDTLRAFFLTGSYWYIRGIDIYRAPDNGIKIEGNHNTVENCVFRDCFDSGIQIGLAKNSVTNAGDSAAYNYVLNCDSYNNCDSHKSGGNADGFANKLCSGPGNHFKGCRAWNNSDDGWDLYQNEHGTLLEECWTWHAGDAATCRDSMAGNGNGFKMGGNSSYGCQNIAYRCVSFDNHYVGGGGKGFDQNDNNRGQIVLNCTSFRNTKNYSFGSGSAEGHVIKNCVSFEFFEKHISFTSENVMTNNSWQTATDSAAADDFQSIAEDLAKAPREADGSLPQNGFCKLVSGSNLIDKGEVVSYTWDGQTVTAPYSGSKPDLGAYESGAVAVKIGANAKVAGKSGVYCSPSMAKDLVTLFFTLEKTGKVRMTIYNAEGKSVRTVSEASFPKGDNFQVTGVSDLAPGAYFFRVIQAGKVQSAMFTKR